MRCGIAAATAGVTIYALIVLYVVATEADIGLRCVFGVEVRQPIDPRFPWRSETPDHPDRPVVGARIEVIEAPGVGTTRIGHYGDLVRAQRSMKDWRDQGVSEVRVGWSRPESPGELIWSWATLRSRPPDSWLRSLTWLGLVLAILALGARVAWKRPDDDASRLFFVICVITVGAYGAGYHWSEIVGYAPLIYLFAFFAVFVPVASLHFYLIFPSPLPWYVRHKRLALGLLYGIPLTCVLILWSHMVALAVVRQPWGWMASIWTDRQLEAWAILLIERIRLLALGYVGLAGVVYAACVALLIARARWAEDPREARQIKWILWASLMSVPLVTLLLVRAVWDSTSLNRDPTAWLMFAVSLLYMIAYAMSITRSKLMQVDEIINRSVAYMAASVAVGVLYSTFLVVGGLLIGEAMANQTSRLAVLAGFTAIVALILTGAARDWFHRLIDRRFRPERYQLDQALDRISGAVGTMIDRPALARRLLEAAGDVLRIDWGALYLADDPDLTTLGSTGNGMAIPFCFPLAASLGPSPETALLGTDHPVVQRLARDPSQRLIIPRAFAHRDEATDAMIALGGEVALALPGADSGDAPLNSGALSGIIILGPKQSGLPYAEEELAFLGALASFAALALRSAATQRTLAELDAELNRKAEEILRQRRRIEDLEHWLAAQTDVSSLHHSLVDEAGAARSTVSSDFDSSLAGVNEGSASSRALSPSPVAERPVESTIVGSSPAVRRMLRVASKVAQGDAAVLITGESGTGKELLTEMIHNAGPRRHEPLVKVHCAALPPTLLESELFGHVKGAFTGADRDRVGRFQQAEGGTLFLDEIGDVNLDVQVKLLRVLQEKAFEPVGSSRTHKVNVRIVAATHQDLRDLIRRGRFREDLYYRLNVVPIRTPPLRERLEDLPELAARFLAKHARRLGKPVLSIEPDALAALLDHDWPGNIRELENTIERAVVLAEHSSLGVGDLPEEWAWSSPSSRRGDLAALMATSELGEAIHPGKSPTPSRPPVSKSSARPRLDMTSRAGSSPMLDDSAPPLTSRAWSNAMMPVEQVLRTDPRDWQRLRLEEALKRAGGNKSEAARLLGIPRSTLLSQLRKHRLA